jgi:hypothetical protein
VYCVLHQGDDDDGGSTHLLNVGLLQRDYTALYPRGLSSSKFQVLYNLPPFFARFSSSKFLSYLNKQDISHLRYFFCCSWDGTTNHNNAEDLVAIYA